MQLRRAASDYRFMPVTGIMNRLGSRPLWEPQAPAPTHLFECAVRLLCPDRITSCVCFTRITSCSWGACIYGDCLKKCMAEAAPTIQLRNGIQCSIKAFLPSGLARLQLHMFYCSSFSCSCFCTCISYVAAMSFPSGCSALAILIVVGALIRNPLSARLSAHGGYIIT